MSINQRRFDVFMPKKFLYSKDIITILKLMSGKWMPKCMTAYSFNMTCLYVVITFWTHCVKINVYFSRIASVFSNLLSLGYKFVSVSFFSFDHLLHSKSFLLSARVYISWYKVIKWLVIPSIVVILTIISSYPTHGTM